MKKTNVLLAFLAIFSFSCSVDPNVREVEALYSDIVKVASSSLSGSDISRFVSPAIRDDNDALEALRSLLEPGYGCRVRILSPTRAVAILSDGRETQIPFVKDEGSGWMIAEHYLATRFIEIVPAAPLNEE